MLAVTRSLAVGTVFCALAILAADISEGPLAQGAKPARINPLIEALEGGGLANSGGPWTFVDMEHGPFDTAGLRKRLADEFGAKRKPNGQIQSAPIVRIPAYGEESPNWMTKQILDAGAMGIIFPQIDTKEQALRAIRAARYPPQRGAKYPTPPGIRGYGPGGARAVWNIAGDEYLKKADLWPLNPDGELFAMVMVESRASIKNLSDILDVPGIGAVFVGPSDLGMNLGVGIPRSNADPIQPELDAALTTIAKTCQAKKVVCGIAAQWATPAYLQKLKDLGYRIFL